ncbi:putative serine/threonine-protein kinase [Ananas comosus]|uniref:Putative serine/threonine-protein kinase n=1 Tax=Ananas comosus TaxID=4615 RepID=A0A199VWI5_ANACO|nr:putative serine/threonine-protein kinase [Ananas comosus]
MKLFLLIAILSSPIPSLSVSPRIGDCQPASCGNVTRISYPFWVGGRQPSYCGHPAFELVCGGDGVPALKSSYDGYYFVRSIFYHNSSVWLGNSNWLHGKCPLPLFNLTFGLSPLAISASMRKKSNLGKKIGIGIGAGAGGILVISFVCLLVYKQKKRKRTPSSSLQLKQTNSSRQILDLELNTAQYRTHIFSYEELEEATDGFNASKELGDGGFGRVYEGKLRDGRTVAVKRLYENSYKRVEQFMNEVDILSRLRHQSLLPSMPAPPATAVSSSSCMSTCRMELLQTTSMVPSAGNEP